jgi:glycerol-3-phosphate acyltransferase PlsY
MAAAVAAPLAALALGKSHSAATLAVMAVLLIWKHRDNIARLRAGTESRIGQKGCSPTPLTGCG